MLGPVGSDLLQQFTCEHDDVHKINDISFAVVGPSVLQMACQRQANGAVRIHIIMYKLSFSLTYSKVEELFGGGISLIYSLYMVWHQTLIQMLEDL